MSFLDKLIREGRVALYHDYRSGSARDFSSNDFHGTPTDIIFYKFGYQSNNGSTGRPEVSSHYANSKLVFDDEMSIIIMPNQIGLSTISGYDASNDTYVQRGDADSVNYQFDYNVSAGDLIFYTDTTGHSSVDQVTSLEGFPFLKTIGMTTKKGEAVNFYANGINFSTSSTFISETIDTTADTMYIGASRSFGSYPHAGMGLAFIIMEKLTDSEMAQLHHCLINKRWPQKTSSFIKAKTIPSNSSVPDPTLIGAWDMSIVGNKVIDQSANVNHATATRGNLYSVDTLFGHAISFEESHLSIATNSDYNLNSGDLTCQLIFKQKDAGSFDPAGLFCIYYNTSNLLWLRQYTNGTIEVYTDESGVGDTQLLLTTEAPKYNTWNHLVLTKTQTGFKLYLNSELVGNVTHSFNHASTSSYYIWIASDQSGREFNGEIADFQMYSEEKDSGWVDEQYKKFANVVQFKTDWSCGESDSNITAGYIGNSKIQVEDGTWQIDTEEVNGKLCKVLTCIAEGTVYIPVTEFMCTETEAAFGTWDFWMYKTNVYTYIFNFGSYIEPVTNGNYRIQFDGTEAAELIECNVAIMDTAPAGTIAVDTWQNIKMTRDNNDGEFNVYLDGNLILNGTDKTSVLAKYISFHIYDGHKICLGAVDGSYAITKYLGVV